MSNNNFTLISNQRCGSTWFITSVGNCENVATDYEVKWSKELLIGKPAPYHLFLDENKMENFFKKFSDINKNSVCGTKFVFDFYKAFPPNHYKKFLSKFKNFKIIHITRDYIDILKSKLIGKVIHLIDPANLEKTRLIDNTILDKQKDYIRALELSKNNNQLINYEQANGYLINLFINDVLAISLKNDNQFLNINYEDINTNMNLISDFLNIPIGDLNKNFFTKPVIKKNNLNYNNNFENYDNLKKINIKLKNKINFLKNNNFDFDKIISYDVSNKKLNINF